ncbi:hypothetical protein NMG60_11013059 [Bertholletia excelsa]
MDVRESKEALRKHSRVETSRQPLVQADNNNGTTRRSRIREVSSRYRSPIPADSRRCPSPNITRTVNPSSQLVSKRAISAERKRPSTPPSPSPTRPSTPVQDTATEMQLATRKVTGSRLSEVLWPSTMRSLSVSFQSDNLSFPITKKEKPTTHALSDRALKPSSNVAQRQAETTSVSRKPTPERKRSPLKGKNAPDQSENSKPVEASNARLVDQHRWPSRTSGKLSSNASSRSVDPAAKTVKISTLPTAAIGISSSRRISLPGGMGKPLQKSVSDVLRLVPNAEVGNRELEAHPVDYNKIIESGFRRPASTNSSERMSLVSPVVRSQSLPTPGSRHPSPSKASVSSSSVSRGVSPSRASFLNATARVVSSTLASSLSSTAKGPRGVSPSRLRPSSPSRQSSSSVLSFIADIKKGKKGANLIEDAHQLRLLYNRHLQWRYINARATTALHMQRVTAEKTLYNVWRTTSELQESVTKQRIDLQQLGLKLKLYSVLNEQMAYLEEWASIERDHTGSLSQAIADLQSTILRLPVTGAARADIKTVKAAIYSAVDVMQAIGSSICSILSRVEGTNCLVSELAELAAQERAMLDECDVHLALTAAMQVKEYSLGTHLIQLKQY